MASLDKSSTALRWCWEKFKDPNGIGPWIAALVLAVLFFLYLLNAFPIATQLSH